MTSLIILYFVKCHDSIIDYIDQCSILLYIISRIKDVPVNITSFQRCYFINHRVYYSSCLILVEINVTFVGV